MIFSGSLSARFDLPRFWKPDWDFLRLGDG